jgi:hypothetical protein
MKLFGDEPGFRAAARRSLVYLPVALLVGFSLLNYTRVRFEQASPWVSGGYGMHSTFDSVLFRFVRVYGIDDERGPHRIQIKREWKDAPVVARPVKANAERLVRRVQSRLPKATARFESFRVETWQYTFPGEEPHLGAHLLTTHRISAQP